MSSTVNIPSSLKFKIIELKKNNHSYNQIADILDVSRQSVAKICKKYDSTGQVTALPRSGRPPVITKKIQKYIDDSYQENDELTSCDLQLKIENNFGIKISVSAIREVRKKIGWVKSGVKYCQ